MKKHESSITLVEAVIVLAIFAVIAATTGSILFTSSRTGWRLADKARVFQDLTWAIDYMINEVRWGSDFSLSPASFVDFDLITFTSDTNRNGIDPDDPCVWYWRGFTTPTVNYGNSSILYRGLDEACLTNFEDSLQAANTNRQELANFLVDNPLDAQGNEVRLFGYDYDTREFSTVLTAQETRTRNNRTLRAKVVILND